ncbi:MAG TPA: DUF2760 domain-containing protein [Chthoniobacterales bacterium]|jgi:hypothetical protein|nr:DUF2760 domain-containing protein [Chthoniobacterales bacterium]
MKAYIVFGAILIVILNGILLLPAAGGHTFLITALALLVGIVVLVLSLLASRAPDSGGAVVAAHPPPPAPVQPPPPAESQAESEIVAFFALLQEKGRLVDFLMEDVAGYEDAEVGAAARVIHQGCRQVLDEYFKISPISDAQEGAQVTLPAGYPTDQYRIIGKLTGEPPFTGTLLHKGWKAESVKLPRIVTTGALPPIAPAEVELR